MAGACNCSQNHPGGKYEATKNEISPVGPDAKSVVHYWSSSMLYRPSTIFVYITAVQSVLAHSEAGRGKVVHL